MVQKTVLENGIRILTERIPSAHSVTIGYWVENGSRHEREPFYGISHFLEHMLFKGTGRRSAFEIAKEIDSVGGILNGFTSREYSCYYAKVLAPKLPMAVDLLSDIFLNSTFNPEELEKERKVILQEIHMVEDTPDDYIHDLFSRFFWCNHPLGFPVMGSRESVAEIRRSHLLDFMSERYCGSQILICAAGNLEHDELAERIEESLGGIAPGESPATCGCNLLRGGLQTQEKDLEQVHICLGTQGLSQNHPNRFVLYLLNAMLGGSMSSRLFQKIREERGLAYSIYSYLNSHTDSGALVLYAGASPAEAGQVVDLMLEQMACLRGDLVGDDELEAAREQLKGNLLMSLESTDNRMSRLAKNEIYVGRSLSVREVLAQIDGVSREDIRTLAERLIRDEYLHLQVIGRIAGTGLSSGRLALG